MIAGSIHFWEYLELLLWLRIVGYDGWYSLDIFPYREDAGHACRESIGNIKMLMKIIDRVGVRNLEEAVKEGRFTAAFSMIRKVLTP